MMLTKSIKELESHGLIKKDDSSTYSLTEIGVAIMEVLIKLENLIDLIG